MEKENLISKMLYMAKISHLKYDEAIGNVAKECGISKQEADVLLFFSNNPCYSNPKDAVIYRGMSKAYVSKSLSDLEKRGLINLETNQNDKRYQYVIIQDFAKDIIYKLKQQQIAFFNELKKGVDERDFDVFIKVIKTMINNIQ